MQVEKQKLRAFAKEFRKNLDKEKRKVKGFSVFQKVINLDEYKKADRVLLYFSKDIEVDTKELINYSLESNKQVFLPKCIGEDMMFYKINSLDDLQQGSFGIFEPKDTCQKYLESSCDDFCIIPALAVDKQKYRLGFGKGYYDRFLKNFVGFKCVICYKENLVERLPVFSTDIPCDMIILD